MPAISSSLSLKIEKPVTPAMDIPRYAQISDQPPMAPAVIPSPLQMYRYMEPAVVERRANWFRLNATNTSMIVPSAYESQLQSPVFPYITGMMRAAVMVGDMSAMTYDSSSTKHRQFFLRVASYIDVVPSCARELVRCAPKRPRLRFSGLHHAARAGSASSFSVPAGPVTGRERRKDRSR